jgi:hypothetical protein
MEDIFVGTASPIAVYSWKRIVKKQALKGAKAHRNGTTELLPYSR